MLGEITLSRKTMAARHCHRRAFRVIVKMGKGLNNDP